MSIANPNKSFWDVNVHESTWLHSSHTSNAGSAKVDFCESRGLH